MPEARATPPPPPDAGHIPITEEMDKARWTLPPAPVVVIGIVVVGMVVAAFSYFGRSQPVAQGAITDVYALPSGDGVLVALQFNLANSTGKPVFLHHLEATVTVAGKPPLTDDHPLSAVDYPRYVKAFPELAQHTSNPIMPETRINPGQRISGAAIFSFDASKEAFDSRQSLVLKIVPYDRPAFTLSEAASSVRPRAAEPTPAPR
ncbi:MAG: hypothetical protein JO041_15400 [Acidobacteria bacterium]|nr:hypothetical protein [Acidobacteriota bacterium]